MIYTPTSIEGCFILQPLIFKDERGYFFEAFNRKKFSEATGLSIDFVQDNQSYSRQGTLRGLHYQTGDASQAKLVRTIKGSVLDVAVDLRPSSPTFGKYVSEVLSSKNHKQLFIPRGFAHGFVVLSDDAIFHYKCDNFYNQSAESGIIYNDKTLNINWQFPEESLIISEKDCQLPSLEDIF